MDQYEEMELIGKGSFGEVWKIKRLSDNKILVWKKLDYGQMNEKEKAQLVSEVNILRDLRHPHIVRYFDRIIDRSKTRIYIIMEYCEYGDLGTLIKRCRREGQWLNEDCIWKIFSQMVQALHECHTRPAKILHRDLKPGNVFLDSSYQVKLGDFGLARVLGENSIYAKTTVGTPYYMSPEQIERSSYNDKSDIWSAGCLLYEMAGLRPPFEAENQYQLAAKIRKGKFKRLPLRYSEELNRVVSWMLNVEPNLRPSVEDLHSVPQVSTRLRERRLREHYGLLKQREEYLKNKEAELNTREAELDERESKINRRQSESECLVTEGENLSIASNRTANPTVNQAVPLCNNRGGTPRSNPLLGRSDVSPRDKGYQKATFVIDNDEFVSPMDGHEPPCDLDEQNINLPLEGYPNKPPYHNENEVLGAKNTNLHEGVEGQKAGRMVHMHKDGVDGPSIRYGVQRSVEECRNLRYSRDASLQPRIQNDEHGTKTYYVGQHNAGMRAASSDAANRFGGLWKEGYVQGTGMRRTQCAALGEKRISSKS